MNKTEKIFIALLILWIAVYTGFTIATFRSVQPQQQNVGGTVDTVFINSNFSPTAVNVSSTRQKLLSVNSSRREAEICNPNVASSSDPTAIVFIVLSNASTSVSTTTGRPVFPGQCYNAIGDRFYYPGEVWALKNSAIVTAVSVQEN